MQYRSRRGAAMRLLAGFALLTIACGGVVAAPNSGRSDTAPPDADVPAPSAQSIRPVAGLALSLDRSSLEDFLEEGGSSPNADYDGASPGGEVDVGLRLGKYTTLRLGHRRFGDQDADLDNGGTAELDMAGNYFAADLMAPVNDSLALGLTLGQLAWDGEITREGGSGPALETESGIDLFAGLRGWVRLNERFGLTLFANRYDLETDDGEELQYEVLGAGLQVVF